MNDQKKGQGNKPPDEECINGAWVDVKLCTVIAKNRRQNIITAVKKEATSADKNSSSKKHDSNLHYGDYD